MRPLAIYGAGGLGREVLSWVKDLSGWSVVGFYDDALDIPGEVNDVPVLGGMDILMKNIEPLNLIVAIGNPAIKKKIIGQLEIISSIHFPTLIHPSVIIQDSSRVALGRGSVISAGVIATTDIQIGSHVLINLNCTIGHDVVVGDGSSIMPGVNIAGSVKIGKHVFIGAGANILNGLSLGDNCVVGAGSLVNKNVGSGETVVGVPAKPIVKQ